MLKLSSKLIFSIISFALSIKQNKKQWKTKLSYKNSTELKSIFVA